MTQQAYATYTVHNTTTPSNSNRACLKGVVEVEASSGDWFAFTVYGFSRDQIQNAAYMQADLLASDKGWDLQALRAA